MFRSARRAGCGPRSSPAARLAIRVPRRRLINVGGARGTKVGNGRDWRRAWPKHMPLTGLAASRILVDVLRFGGRVSVAVLLVALASGHPALCAGWMPSLEAPMACCAGRDACPMRHAAPDSPATTTQGQADNCCAASEERDLAPSALVFAPSTTVLDRPAPALWAAPALSPAPRTHRTTVPIPGPRVARHLLLSVFLV